MQAGGGGGGGGGGVSSCHSCAPLSSSRLHRKKAFHALCLTPQPPLPLPHPYCNAAHCNKQAKSDTKHFPWFADPSRQEMWVSSMQSHITSGALLLSRTQGGVWGRGGGSVTNDRMFGKVSNFGVQAWNGCKPPSCSWCMHQGYVQSNTKHLTVCSHADYSCMFVRLVSILSTLP